EYGFGNAEKRPEDDNFRARRGVIQLPGNGGADGIAARSALPCPLQAGNQLSRRATARGRQRSDCPAGKAAPQRRQDAVEVLVRQQTEYRNTIAVAVSGKMSGEIFRRLWVVPHIQQQLARLAPPVEGAQIET